MTLNYFLKQVLADRHVAAAPALHKDIEKLVRIVKLQAEALAAIDEYATLDEKTFMENRTKTELVHWFDDIVMMTREASRDCEQILAKD